MLHGLKCVLAASNLLTFNLFYSKNYDKTFRAITLPWIDVGKEIFWTRDLLLFLLRSRTFLRSSHNVTTVLARKPVVRSLRRSLLLTYLIALFYYRTLVQLYCVFATRSLTDHWIFIVDVTSRVIEWLPFVCEWFCFTCRSLDSCFIPPTRRKQMNLDR